MEDLSPVAKSLGETERETAQKNEKKIFFFKKKSFKINNGNTQKKRYFLRYKILYLVVWIKTQIMQTQNKILWVLFTEMLA